MLRSRSSPVPFSLGHVLQEGALAALLVILVPAVAVTLTYQWLAITHRFPLDYGEAPLVDQALRLAAWQNIYRPDLSTPPYTTVVRSGTCLP